MARATRKTIRRYVASLFGSRAAYSISNALVRRIFFPYVRCVAYHDTPARFESNLATHLQWYSEHFVDCERADLDRFLADGVWPHSKPGLIISFDDGLRSNAEVAAPLLKRYGFNGWFMVPAGVPRLGAKEDRFFADEVLIPHSNRPDDQRLFLDWNDLRSLVTAGHQICCHSFHHLRLGEALSDAELDVEILKSKALFEHELGRDMDAFAWVGGENHTFSRAAFQKIQDSGYKIVFSGNCLPITAKDSPLCLERNHVDVTYRLDDVRLSIGGFYDLLYSRKRDKIRRVIGLEPAA